MPTKIEGGILDGVEFPDLEPHEIMAAFDPGTWFFAKAIFVTLRRKGLIEDADLPAFRQVLVDGKEHFEKEGETQRVEAMDFVLKWLDEQGA